MKKECTNCIYYKDGKCSKSKKNGYFNCQTYKAIPISELTKEYKLLLVSKDNPERLQHLKEKLENLNGGTI